MKSFARVAAMLAVCALAVSCQRQEAPGPDVWAVVNGKEIRRQEVEKYYRSRVNTEGQQPSQEEALTLELSILDELTTQEILYERATKLNLLATDGEVEDKFRESKSPYTDEEFQKKLNEGGLSVDDLKNDIRRQLSIQKLLNREVFSKISITDQDLSDFYNHNQAQFNLAETQYHLAEIVVTPRPDPQIVNRKNDDAKNETEARQKLQMLEARIGEGADFTQLAMDYSEDPTASIGGDLGFVPESSLSVPDPQLKSVVLALQPGATSKPILSHGSYYILKLLAKEPAGHKLLSDPQTQQIVRTTLRNRKEQLLRASYIAIARNESQVTNYLARFILESNGKLPPIPSPK
ncbi:MAG: peptidylprolyl isomerase [Candidatus Acidiferrales bacterium]